jgi:hypothetical protein
MLVSQPTASSCGPVSGGDARPRPAPLGQAGARPGRRSASSAPPSGACPAHTAPPWPQRDLPHDRQAQARAGHRPRPGRSVEAVEHPRQVLLRDPGPGVGHLQQHRPLVERPHLHPHRPARRAPLGGVVEQVEHRAFQRVAVPDERPRHERRGELDVAGPRRARSRARETTSVSSTGSCTTCGRPRVPARPGRRPASTAPRSAPAGRRGSRAVRLGQRRSARTGTRRRAARGSCAWTSGVCAARDRVGDEPALLLLGRPRARRACR